jgi:hypothetical protein
MRSPHLFDRFGLVAQPVDLGEAGDAGAHLVVDHVAADQLAVLLVVGGSPDPGRLMCPRSTMRWFDQSAYAWVLPGIDMRTVQSLGRLR